VRTDELQPDDIEGGRVQELAEAVRTLLQENLFDMVAHRRSIWLG
jgi:hypothetical protein